MKINTNTNIKLVPSEPPVNLFGCELRLTVDKILSCTVQIFVKILFGILCIARKTIINENNQQRTATTQPAGDGDLHKFHLSSSFYAPIAFDGCVVAVRC